VTRASDRPPRVSIVIPVFNGANYLRTAIDSALAQTHPDVEVIVVNDGSTDGGATDAIARRYGDRIRYLVKANGGVATALNLGIQEMTGEYFSWLSHDDVYLPEKVAAQVARVVPGAPPSVLFGDYAFIDAAGKQIGVKRFHGRVDAMRYELVVGDPVNGCTVLVPRRCLESVGPFDSGLRTIQDYDMWFRLAARFPFVHQPGIHLLSRIHPLQGTRTIPTYYPESARVLARFVEELPDEEVRRVHGEPVALGWARLALRLKLRGFDEASRAALSRGRAVLTGAGPAARAGFAARAAACVVLTRKVKPAYWLGRIRSAGAGRSKGTGA
jgi:glycosyltransferase involved in cell wall biosynthesis